MMRRALVVLALVASLPVALLAALGTEAVRDRVLGAALEAVGASVREVEGSLLGTLELRGLHLPSAGLEVAALRLRWEPAALLRGELLVERIGVDRPILELAMARDPATPAAPPPPFAGLELPLPVRLEELSLRGGTIRGLDGLAGLQLDLSAAADGVGSRIDVRDVDLEASTPERGTLAALGALTLTLTPELPWKTDLRVALVPPEADGLELAVEAEGDLLQARASFDLLDPWAVHGELASEDLTAGSFRAVLRLADPIALPELRLLGARLEAAGDPTAVEVRAEADLELDDPLGAGRLAIGARADATVDRERVVFALSAATPGVELDAEGTTRLADLATAAALRLAVQDGSRWLADRALAFEARADVELAEPRATDPALAVRALALTGQLDGRTLALDGDADLRLGAAPGAEALALDLTLGRNRLRLEGRAQETLDLALDLDAPALTEISPTLAGRANVRGRLGGTRAAPTLMLDGTAEALGFGEAKVAELTAEAAFDAGAGTPLALKLDASELRHPALPEPLRMRLEAGGDRDAIAATLRGELGADALETRLELAADDTFDVISGRLTNIDLQTAVLGHWQLAEPAALRVTRAERRFELERACLASEAATLCADPLRMQFPAAGPADLGTVTLVLDALAWDRLEHWLPSGMGLDGTLSGRASLDGARQSLALTSREVGLTLRDPASAEELFSDRLRIGELALEREDDRVSGALRLNLDAAGTAKLSGTLRADLTAGRYEDLDLTTDLAIADLAFLAPLLPALDAPSGSLEGRAEIRGSLADPVVTGRLDARGAAFVPALGRPLALRELELTGSANEGLRFEGTLLVDEAELAFGGNADYALEPGLTASLTLSGRDAQIVALPDLALWVSPDLEATLADDVLDLRGRVHLPRARIAITSVPASGPTRSSDLVLHRPERGAPKRPLRTRADVDLSLGDDVELIAGSLRTRLIGKLELALGLDETLTARGLIETRGGSVSRFGRELAIARGRLAFDGPITRPDLSVTGTRTVGTREVGVTISGPPDALQTTLFSSPPADDATTLTMLVTGREPSEASREDADRVSAAAFGLGVGVANPVLQDLGERFGIEEFGIDTGTGTGAVVAGTRLSERLYARYAYTLATRTSGLQLEYRISDRLSARTETGPVTALDLLYRREFD